MLLTRSGVCEGVLRPPEYLLVLFIEWFSREKSQKDIFCKYRLVKSFNFLLNLTLQTIQVLDFYLVDSLLD